MILFQLLEKMIRIRLFEETIAERYKEQEMRCPVHLSIGQEGPAAGLCQVLSGADMLFSHHRSHGHYIAKGGDTGALISEFYGKETGCCEGIGGSMHLIDRKVGYMASIPIVGGIVPIAVGAAMASVFQNKKLVTAVFLGDATMEEGAVHESLNFAALKKLPVIFFCENNLYSVYTHLRDRQPDRPIADLARGHHIKTFTVDGNDVEAVFEISKQAYEYAKSGAGPVFIEASTYRWREHCGPFFDNDIGYRTEEEYQEWKKLCPIEKLEARLLSEDKTAAAKIEGIREKIKKEIAAAFLFAEKSEFPKKEKLFQNLFAGEV